MAIRYVLENFINVSTLDSVSSEDTLYVKGNMYNKRQSLPWRMTAKTNQYAVFDLGSDRPTIICILNHNFNSGVTLTLKADDDPPNWGAPAWTQALTYHALNIWYSWSDKDYRWWRLEISDAGNPSNPEIGELVLYTYGTFTRNYRWPYTEGIEYVKGDLRTAWGQRWRQRRAKLKKFALEFYGVSDTHLVSEIEAFFEALDGDLPFVLIPEHTESDCWYVDCLNDLEARREFYNINSFTLDLEEQSRGIELL